jgi:lysophospholipase L1-like esterase
MYFPGITTVPPRITGTLSAMWNALLSITVALTMTSPPAALSPIPSPETRSHPAGWRGRSWLDQHQDGIAFLQRSDHPRGADLVLLGDSITQSFGGDGRDTGQPGREALTSALPGIVVANQGISGDRTQHLLWRLEHGALADRDPDFVAIMIGTNNLPHDAGAEIGAGIIEIARSVRRLSPRSTILLHAIPPRGGSPLDPMRRRVLIANALVRSHVATDSSMVWVDPWSDLLTERGHPRPGFVAGDAVHLGPDGYRLWAETLASFFTSTPDPSSETRP